MRTFFLFAVLLYVCLSANSQCTIRGKVVDSNKSACAYSNVRLLSNDSIFIKGTITDSLGNYTLKDIEKNVYILLFSSIGYQSLKETVRVTETEQEIPPVVLQTQNIVLDELVVKGNSFIRQKDRVLVIPEKQQTKHASNGYDLLYNLMIPNINVDKRRGVVSTFGGEVTLYIDGRKAEYREIQGLRPKDIEKIEYFDAPTGKYAGDVASINYITKKYNTGGYVSLDARQTIGYFNGDYNVVGKLSHNHTEYVFFGGYNRKEYDGNFKSLQESFLFPETPVTRESNTAAARNETNQQYGQMNVLNSNAKRTLLGRFLLMKNNAPEDSQYNEMTYRKAGEEATEQQSSSFASQSSLIPSLLLYGNFNWGKHNLETSLKSTYFNNDYKRNYSEGEEDFLTDIQEDFYDVKASARYIYRPSSSRSFMASLSHTHKVTFSDYQGDYESWQHLWSSETVLDLEYYRNWKNKYALQVLSGVSSLRYHLHGYEQINHLYPRLNLSFTCRPTSQQQLKLQLKTDNTYPEMSAMNNVTQVVDIFQLKRGNPLLEKTDFYDATLLYGLNVKRMGMQAGVSYNYANHLTANQYSVEDNKLVHSFTSNAFRHGLESMLSLSWKATDHLRIKFTNYWLRTILEGDVSATQNSWFVMGQIDYYWKNFAFDFYINTFQKELGNTLVHRKKPGEYGFSIHWVRNNFQMECGMNNPFSSHSQWEYVLHTSVYDYHQTQWNKTLRQAGYIKLAYTLDFGKKTSRENNQVDKSINSAILKAQ